MYGSVSPETGSVRNIVGSASTVGSAAAWDGPWAWKRAGYGAVRAFPARHMGYAWDRGAKGNRSGAQCITTLRVQVLITECFCATCGSVYSGQPEQAGCMGCVVFQDLLAQPRCLPSEKPSKKPRDPCNAQ